MQTKTMNKVIKNKLTAWLETIKDKKLRGDVKKNILVSGGSIASMFLGEPVNDYDIYLQDRNVLERLVKYYLESLKDRKLILTEDSVKDYPRASGALEIALQNITNEQVKIFFSDDVDKGGIKLYDREDWKEGEYKLMFVSPNALSLSDKIQIVTRFTGSPEQIHKTFDFIHATNYFTFEDGLVTNKEALESLLTKWLRYQGSRYPLTSIIRFKKFVKRGWDISAGEILKIMYQIGELDLKNPNVLEEQLIGVDVAYFSALIEILRNAGDVKITSKYLNNIIDRVFNEDENE